MSSTLQKRLQQLEAQHKAQIDATEHIADEHDADLLSDEDVLQVVLHSLFYHPKYSSMLGMSPDGEIIAGFKGENFAPRYWQRIADRAMALCKEQDIILIPLKPSEMRQALDYFRQGIFFAQEPNTTNTRYGHMWTVCCSLPYKSAERDALMPLIHSVVYALDCYMYQTHAAQAFIESAPIITLIEAWLEESHAQHQTAARAIAAA